MKIVGKQFKNFRPSPGLMPVPSIQYFTRIYSYPRSLLVGFPASSILNTRPSKLRWRGIWNVAIFAKVWHFSSQWSLWMKAGCPSSCQRWSPSRCNGSQRVRILRKKPRSNTPPKNSCLLHSLIVTAWFTSINSQKVKPSIRPTTARLSRPFLSHLRRKRPEKFEQGWILHQDNARPHVSRETMEFFSKKNIETLPHAPYSPDLAPCDFWLFPQLKTRLEGQCFDNEEGLKQAEQGVLGQLCQGGLLHAFESWMERIKKCIDVGGILEKIILIKFFCICDTFQENSVVSLWF